MSKCQALIESAPWYSVDKSGAATLCTGQDDAIATATDSQTLYPRNGPYEATQLVPVATIRDLLADLERAEKALLKVARMAEDLKRPCSMEADSPQAIRNGQYMNISYEARAALAQMAKGE